MMAELDAAPCKATTLSGPSVVVSPRATSPNGAPSSARRTSPWPSASAKAASRAETFDDAERARAEKRRTRQSGSVSWVKSRWTPGGTRWKICGNCFPKLKGMVSQRQKLCRTASFLLVSELYRSRQSFLGIFRGELVHQSNHVNVSTSLTNPLTSSTSWTSPEVDCRTGSTNRNGSNMSVNPHVFAINPHVWC